MPGGRTPPTASERAGCIPVTTLHVPESRTYSRSRRSRHGLERGTKPFVRPTCEKRPADALLSPVADPATLPCDGRVRTTPWHPPECAECSVSLVLLLSGIASGRPRGGRRADRIGGATPGRGFHRRVCEAHGSARVGCTPTRGACRGRRRAGGGREGARDDRVGRVLHGRPRRPFARDRSGRIPARRRPCPGIVPDATGHPHDPRTTACLLNPRRTAPCHVTVVGGRERPATGCSCRATRGAGSRGERWDPGEARSRHSNTGGVRAARSVR